MLHYARGKVFNYYKYLSLRELRGEITLLYTETASASVLYNFCCLRSGDGVENELLLPSANLVPNGDRCGSMPMIVALVGTLRKCSNFSQRGESCIHPSFQGNFFTSHVERARMKSPKISVSFKNNIFLNSAEAVCVPSCGIINYNISRYNVESVDIIS